MKYFKAVRWFPSILAALVILCTGITAAHAATIDVTANAADVLNGANASCSLREAITNINNGALTYADCPNTGGGYGTSDTINIPAGTYTTARAGANEDLNATGDYDINKSVSIVGAGASTTIIDGGALDGVFHITGAFTVSFSGVTIQNGNTAGDGAGITNNGTLTVTNSTISGNTSGWMGGGITNNGTLTVTVTNSTISGNTAMAGGGITNKGTLTVTNSTISGNTATWGGGGIYNGNTLTVTNSTIVRNTAPAGGGGGVRGAVSLINSIVADNGVGLDCVGAITNNGWNIDSDSSCTGFTHSVAMVQGTGFSALASNGGPTQTHALLAGSAAIDTGDNATCAAAPVSGVDQRGTARPQGETCDIGAYELVQQYTVTPSAGAGGTINPSTPQNIASGSTTSFTVTPGAGYTTSSVGGSCGGSLSGTTYTTNAITANCTVSASFTLNTYTVTPSAGAGGTINPSTSQTITHGATTTFTVTPNAGYTASVGGSCGGTLVGTTYTTNVITGGCLVAASFTLNTYTVTPSAGANGSINPATPQTINSGSTTTFTVTPNAGYTASVGGTCGGSLSGTTYTTNAITANCTVAATFAAIPPNCTYSLSTSSLSFSANGGTGSFNVNQNETSCNNSGWTATSNASWLTLTPGSGNWSSTPVTITVSANTSNASRTGTITVKGQNNSSTITITQNALLSLSPSTLNYGTFKPGETATQSLTVTNVSGGSLTLSSVNIAGADSSDFTLTNNCNTLSNNGSCTLDVKFTPTTASSKTATLTITANGISFAATLTGTADNNAKPMISVTPSEVNGYLDLELGSYITLTAGNTGTGTLLINSMKFYGEDLYEYAATNSCSLIRPSESCSISLSSAYASNQAKNASLVITSNASNAGKLEIPVNMISRRCAAGDINITPGSATVSSLALTGVLTVTATNNCWWTTSSKSAWISSNTTNWTQGNGTVNYTVSANTGSASRIGTVNVGGLPFTIIQYASGVSRNYTDISGYKFEDNINALYSAGIANQATDFYPANPATKEDIADYIIRSVYGETFTYTTTPYFSDVPATHPSFKYVQKLKDDNITWAGGVYGINSGIKRSQAAGFVIRAIYGETFSYPSAPYFSDVPVDHVYFKYIQKMKERGFTHVPTGSEYLPDNIMGRDSLAAFITDAFMGMEHY